MDPASLEYQQEWMDGYTVQDSAGSLANEGRYPT